MEKRFKITKSCHNQDCIEINNPTDFEKQLICSTIFNNWMDTEEYKVKTLAGAFLQCNHKEYILVEFWGRDPNPFVDFLNKKYEENING